MWTRVTTLALVVAATLVASQKSLVDYSPGELKVILNDASFMPELVSCANCQSGNCRQLAQSILRDMHVVIKGCNGCNAGQTKLLNSLLPAIQKKYPSEYNFLRQKLGTGPLRC